MSRKFRFSDAVRAARAQMKRPNPALRLGRRDFLRTSAAVAGGISAFGGLNAFDRLAHAQIASDPDMHYIFCYFSGGWDILVGLDPREPYPADFREEYIDNLKINPGYELLGFNGDPLVRPFGNNDMVLGPYCGDLADPAVAQHCLVLRGMSMETLTHEVGRRRFLTGRPPSGLTARGSSADTWLAATLGAGETIPNLSLNVESYNDAGELPSYASALRTSSLSDLLRVLNPGDLQLSAEEDALLGELLQNAARCPGPLESPMWQEAEVARQMAVTMVEAQVGSQFDFYASNPEAEAIRGAFGLDSLSSSERYTAPETQAATAVTALKAGVSRCVSIRVASGLDTHFDNWIDDQGPRQERGFNAIGSMIRDLQASQYKDTGDTWLDHTVIVGFSEFCRTPLINASDGRDHWLLNACLVAGGKVDGGKTIGASSDVGMNPLPIDFNTGALDQGGEIVRPEHVIQALMHKAGIVDDEPDLRVPPLEAIWRS